jgi:hypothetical protein
MKATDLLRWITENEIEYHWHDEDVIIMPYIFQLESFTKLLSKSIFDDDGIPCNIKDGYVCIYMDHICSYSGIELADVFPDKNA